jgi:hypothetical protein
MINKGYKISYETIWGKFFYFAPREKCDPRYEVGPQLCPLGVTLSPGCETLNSPLHFSKIQRVRIAGVQVPP